MTTKWNSSSIEAEMKKFHNDETIIRFVDWRRVENKDSSKGVKISRKEIVMWPLSEVIKMLEEEVKNMREQWTELTHSKT